jgi:hypothetical protein
MKMANVAVGMAMAMALGSRAEAAQTANATVLASVSSVLSVALAGSPSNFNPVAAASVTVGNSAIVATNDGSGITETYEVSLTDPADWTSAGAAGSDVYAMSGQFNVAAPLSGSYGASHLLTTTPVLSSITQFAGDQNAENVAHLATRNFWLRFSAPTITSFTAVQSITVVVTAQP